MNQRKRGRKCQLQPKRAPATQALLALPFCLKFAPFPGCLRAYIYKTLSHHNSFLDFMGPQIILGESDCFEACSRNTTRSPASRYRSNSIAYLGPRSKPQNSRSIPKFSETFRNPITVMIWLNFINGSAKANRKWCELQTKR